ncbi:MAG: biotin--[acetyl-CoA-carboxylase] ligase, partial [Desulfobacterales bacterium]|nr:biotin--[acetyl-CoA-carboxylase] ligase [Desulfobacterales bacterium]
RIGVGLNVNNETEQEEYPAVSLKRLIGRQVPRREILIAFLNRFEQRLVNFKPQTVIDEWKANNATIGRHVRVATVKKTIEGIAIDIDSHGGLIVEMADGRHETALHGDCFHH